MRASIALLAAVCLLLITAPAVLAPGAQAPSPSVAWQVDRPGDATGPEDIVSLDGHHETRYALAFPDRVEARDDAGQLLWRTSGLPDTGSVLTGAQLTGDSAEDALVATTAAFDPTGAALTALDGADGTVLWQASLGGQQSNELITLPTEAGQLVVSASMDSLATGRVEAYAAATGASAWSTPMDTPIVSVAHLDGTVAAGTTDGRLHLLDAATGQVLDTLDVEGQEDVRDVIALPDGTGLAAVAEDGVTALDPGFDEVWRYTPDDGRLWSGTTATVDGQPRLYMAGWDGPHVHALNVADGTVAWTAGTGGERTSFPFISPDAITLSEEPVTGTARVVAAGATDLNAYDPGTGEHLWTAPTPGSVDHLATGTDGATALVQRVWFAGAVDAQGTYSWSLDLGPYEAGVEADWDGDGTEDAIVSTPGHIYVHDGEDGTVHFQAQTWPLIDRGITTNVAVADLNGDDHLDLVASARNTSVRGVVVAWDGATGEMLWEHRAGHILGANQQGLQIADLDLDGDPELAFVSNGGAPAELRVLDAATGELQWANNTKDDIRAFTIATPPVGPPVLVVAREHTSCGCHDAPAVLGFLGLTGTQLWERTLELDAVALATVRGPLGLQHVAVQDLSSGQGAVPVDPTAPEEPAFVLLDPLTGLPVTTLHTDGFLGENDRLGPFFHAMDVDGDDRDELLVQVLTGGRRGGGSSLVALSTQDGEVVWQSATHPGNLFPVAPGPTNEAGGVDVLAHWGGQAARLAQLDGTSGAPVWEHPTTEQPTWYIGAGATDGEGARVFVSEGTQLTALALP